MMQQRRRLILRVGKAEVIPPLVEEPLKQVGRSERVGLRARERVPAIGRHRPGRGMLRLDEIGDEQGAARREPIGRRLVDLLLLRVVEMVQAQRRHDQVHSEHRVPPIEGRDIERGDARARPEPGKPRRHHATHRF